MTDSAQSSCEGANQDAQMFWLIHCIGAPDRPEDGAVRQDAAGVLRR